MVLRAHFTVMPNGDKLLIFRFVVEIHINISRKKCDNDKFAAMKEGRRTIYIIQQ